MPKRALREKKRDIETKLAKIEELNNQLGELETKKNIKKKSDLQSKKKNMVQTSFFKPIVKIENIIDENLNKYLKLINDIDINGLTPVDAMKKLIELKEKIKHIRN